VARLLLASLFMSTPECFKVIITQIPMPSYFYHLRFELYPYPGVSDSSQEAHNPHPELFLPPQDCDIFSTPLPVHNFRISESAGRNIARRHHRTGSGSTALGPITHPSKPPILRSKTGEIKGRTSERELEGSSQSASDDFGLGSHSTVDLGYLSKCSHTDQKPRDWRFDCISIESIDMVPNNAKADGQRPRGKSTTVVGGSIGVGPGGLTTKGRYEPSNPKNTEIGWGVVHLYRDNEETPDSYDGKGNGSSADGQGEGNDDESPDLNDCTTLCILAVPSYLTPSEFMGFVGDKTREEVSHFRMIRTGRINRYMVLMKFYDAKKAREWRHAWDGKVFNSMEVSKINTALYLVCDLTLHRLARKLPYRICQIYSVPVFKLLHRPLELSRHDT
jgi:BRCA1-associated protein